MLVRLLGGSVGANQERSAMGAQPLCRSASVTVLGCTVVATDLSASAARCRNSETRASSTVVTGTVMASTTGINKGCNASRPSRYENCIAAAMATHQLPSVQAGADGCMRRNRHRQDARPRPHVRTIAGPPGHNKGHRLISMDERYHHPLRLRPRHGAAALASCLGHRIRSADRQDDVN